MNTINKTQLSITQAAILAVLFITTLFLDEKGSVLPGGLLIIVLLFSFKINWLTVVSFIIFLIGALAKLEHWWWSSHALIMGAIGIVISLLIAANKKRSHWTMILTLTSTVVVFSGLLLKLEHLWMASYLIIWGLLLSCLCYTLRFALKPSKNIYDISKLLLSWSAVFGYLLALEHWDISFTLAIIQTLILMLFIVLSFIDIYSDRKYTQQLD